MSEQEKWIAELRDALARLTLEARHHRTTGRGVEHLNSALVQADKVLDKVPA